MKMQYKTVPFEIELAKKIQSGEVEGRIVTNNGYSVRIICFNKRTSSGYPILGLIDYPNQSEMCKAFNVYGLCYGQPVEYALQIELPEETPEEQHPIEESELYQAGYKVGFEAGRCVAFDEKKGHAIKKETPKHEFKPFDKVLVRQSDKDDWRVALYSHFNAKENLHVTAWLSWYQCIPYSGNEHLVGTTYKPKEE